jgi:hypothetical protein
MGRLFGTGSAAALAVAGGAPPASPASPASGRHSHEHGGNEHGGHSHADAAPASLTEMAPPVEPGGAVFVDVGPTAGALLLWSSAQRAGLEVEIHPAEDPAARTHVWVLPRSLGATGDIGYAAVFPALAPGKYCVLDPGRTTVVSDVTVEAGQVANSTWA